MASHSPSVGKKSRRCLSSSTSRPRSTTTKRKKMSKMRMTKKTRTVEGDPNAPLHTRHSLSLASAGFLTTTTSSRL
ncbi:uncharacterized protein M6B38_398360 [Iris pallida]|uniref:Uncharacterized protein n=1 Tax=Iris pallida TaxID=29817 RepID=A0AAX6FUZ3_IRIPA|nr:uncharacterized protein M6B38_398360 [Iris pallida]